MSNIEWPNLPSPSADIYIIGLGAGELTDMSLASWHALQNAQVVLLRTERHPSASQLQQYIEYTSLDYLYEAHDEFADVYAEIVDQVVARSQEIRAAATQDESRTDKKGGRCICCTRPSMGR